MVLVLFVLIILMIVGELFRPKGRTDNMHILIGGIIVALSTFFLGHNFAYQKTVSEIAEWQKTEADSSATLDYSGLSDLQIFHEFTRNILNDDQVSGRTAYRKYLTHVGFYERLYHGVYRHVKDGWMYVTWLFQMMMLGFGVYAVHYSIDPKYELIKERQKEVKKANPSVVKKVQKPKQDSSGSPKYSSIELLHFYIKDAKTEWKDSQGEIIPKTDILDSKSLGDVYEIGLNGQSRDKEGRALFDCLLLDRRSVDLIIDLIKYEKKRLKSRYVDVYGKKLHLLAEVFEPIRSWGLYTYFDERYPPYYTKAEYERLSLIAFDLIKLGADINMKNERGITPFMIYSKSPISKKFYKWLIKTEAKVQGTDKYGKSALFYALEQKGNELERIELLIKVGVDVLERDKQKKTVLHYAASYGKEDLFWRLFEEVPEANKGLILTECLAEVTRSTDKEFLRRVTEEERRLSKKVGYPETENGHLLWNRDIYNALWVRDNESLEQILKEGGSYHLNDAGKAINTAVAFNNAEGLKILINHGAKVIEFHDHFTPYMRIAFNRPNPRYTLQILQLLEPLNISVDAIDDYDHTALDHLSGVNNYTNIREDEITVEFGKYLLAKGANPLRVCSTDGLNPLQRARKKNLHQLTSVLAKKANEINSK